MAEKRDASGNDAGHHSYFAPPPVLQQEADGSLVGIGENVLISGVRKVSANTLATSIPTPTFSPFIPPDHGGGESTVHFLGMGIEDVEEVMDDGSDDEGVLTVEQVAREDGWGSIGRRARRTSTQSVSEDTDCVSFPVGPAISDGSASPNLVIEGDDL